MKRFLVEVCNLVFDRSSYRIRGHLDVTFADEVYKIAETLAAYFIDTALEQLS